MEALRLWRASFSCVPSTSNMRRHAWVGLGQGMCDGQRLHGRLVKMTSGQLCRRGAIRGRRQHLLLKGIASPSILAISTLQPEVEFSPNHLTVFSLMAYTMMLAGQETSALGVTLSIMSGTSAV